MIYILIVMISLILSILMLINDHREDQNELILHTASSVLLELLTTWVFLSMILIITYTIFKLVLKILELLI